MSYTKCNKRKSSLDFFSNVRFGFRFENSSWRSLKNQLEQQHSRFLLNFCKHRNNDFEIFSWNSDFWNLVIPYSTEQSRLWLKCFLQQLAKIRRRFSIVAPVLMLANLYLSNEKPENRIDNPSNCSTYNFRHPHCSTFETKTSGSHMENPHN